MQTVWWVIFGISLVIALILTGIIIPKIFFKTGYEFLSSHDRGLKNFKEKNGRTIVYEPKPEYRKYISQYILSERNGKTVIKCKLNENISYIDYDIVLFKDNNKVFKVINVVENIENTGYTRTFELPSKTAYAALAVNVVNNNIVSSGTIKKVSNSSPVFFSLITALFVITEIFCLKLCLANIYGDVFNNIFMTSVKSVFITLGIGLLAALANIIAVIGYNKLKNKKKAENPDNYGV